MQFSMICAPGLRRSLLLMSTSTFRACALLPSPSSSDLQQQQQHNFSKVPTKCTTASQVPFVAMLEKIKLHIT